MQKVIIIIPTYNERDNIVAMIDSLQSIFSGIKNYALGILIFDSNSPDKTADSVRELQKKYSNLYLHSEEKKSGLGSAYIQAMQYAINTLHADIVFEFDADGSHKPEYFPAILREFDQGADVVIGSRYVKGGSIPKDWAWYRKFLSVFGNLASRLVLSFKIKDFTTGFRGIRTSMLKKINLPALKSKGYAYKIQLMWELLLLKARIKEFPIQFVDRTKGESKLPKNNAIESLYLIFYLRYVQLKRYLKVCLVGGVGLCVQLLFFNIFRLCIRPEFANMISAEIAVITGFILNNFFTFSDRRISSSYFTKTVFKKFAQFNCLAIFSLALQTTFIYFGGHFIGNDIVKDNIYVLLGVGIGSIINYKFYHLLIWKK